MGKKARDAEYERMKKDYDEILELLDTATS